MSNGMFSKIMARKPVCYMLIGPPACGKSTYRATLIATLINPVVVSGDDLIEADAARLGLTYDQAFPLMDFKVQKKMLREAFDGAVKAKSDIVVDRTNMSVKSRRSFLSSLPSDYKRVGVVFQFEQEALFARLHKRGKETGKSVPHKTVMEMIERFQPPADGEFHEVININSFVDAG